MISSRIVVHRYLRRTDPSRPSKAGETLVSFDEFKHWLRKGRILRHLFRYDEAVMLVYETDQIGQPFVSALCLWLLARRKSRFEDRRGVSLGVDLGLLVRWGSRLAGDLLSRGKALARIQGSLAGLEAAVRPRPRLDLSGSPLYLRTDLTAGMPAGGAVVHIAGVLNRLKAKFKKTLFATTDVIPEVRADIMTRRLSPGKAFPDFREVRILAANAPLEAQVSAILDGRRTSFIYQRYSLDNFTGVKVALSRGLPLVLEFNSSEIWKSKHWDQGLVHEDLARRIEEVNLRFADLIVVVSRPLKDLVVRMGIPPGKILVNPNGVDTDRYSPRVSGAGIRAKYGWERKVVIGFIGTFGKWHGADHLCRAFVRMVGEDPRYREKVRLLMIGDGEDLPLCREVVERHGLSRSVAFTGMVRQDQGPLYLAACDILASTAIPYGDDSEFFHSPLKLFEYMAMGKAIVASRLGQVPEILDQGRTALLVPAGDEARTAGALRKLVDDGKLRASMGRRARRDALAKHTWEEHTLRILEGLKKVCG